MSAPAGVCESCGWVGAVRVVAFPDGALFLVCVGCAPAPFLRAVSS